MLRKHDDTSSQIVYVVAVRRSNFLILTEGDELVVAEWHEAAWITPTSPLAVADPRGMSKLGTGS
jgi:hypothetical protein